MRSGKMTCISRFIGAALGVALMGIAGTSCERIYDDLEPCPHGVSLRFVYDYNMEFADAFPKKVDCLTVLVYDAKGTHVATHTVAGAELQDEHFRMNLDLEEGDYSFVAYGGMACERRSFDFGTLPRPGARLDELTVALDRDCLTDPDRKRLHDLYWGTLALRTADLYREGVVEMMKNTNNIRIVLQQQHGEPVDDKDFLFEIHDDNTLFSGVDNDLIAAGPVTYTPWITGQASTGVIIVGDKAETAEAVVAFAELSVSRLMTENSSKLLVKRRSDGKTIIDFPLNRYLLLLRSAHYDMDDQEFLDRQSEWTLFFFLDSGNAWIDSKIVVNDWVVRIDDIEFE